MKNSNRISECKSSKRSNRSQKGTEILYNPYLSKEDNIIAPATAAGKGAIGIIRISGHDAITIADSLFKPYSKRDQRRSGLRYTEAYKLCHGTISEEDGSLVDDIMSVVFRAPHSYTGENSVELYCHASSYIMNRLITLLCDKSLLLLESGKISHPLRLASPGEFTKRAFINGKMDLAEAEAVADLIASENKASHDIAIKQIRGEYSRQMRYLREELINLISLVELELDFSEEEVEFADRERLGNLLFSVEERISKLEDSFKLGNAIKNGIPVAIVGAVNAGKSTLLNALLGEERAIVSPIKGTTRDAIEDTINIGATTFRFIDTAGIRKATNQIEQLGIERTFKKLAEASVILLVVDCSNREEFAESIKSILSNGYSESQKLIIVANKSDLITQSPHPICKDKKVACSNVKELQLETNVTIVKELKRICKELKINCESVLCISLIKNKEEAVAEIKESLTEYGDKVSSCVADQTLVTNIRHHNALKSAHDSVKRAQETLASALSPDLLAQDIKEVADDIGSIIGDITTEEVLSNIFANFCIGK